MIRDPTVLILGAGASNPYGFPLGGGLVDWILRDLTEGQATSAENSGGALLTVLRRLDLAPDDVEAFRTDLEGSGLRSIDLFLEDLKPDDVYVQIGKVAIAHTVLWQEYHANPFGPDRANAHWYEYVWNLMRPGSSPETLNRNGLRIVTFNYDLSFEYYFTKAIRHSFRIREWSEASSLFQRSVPVVHLHGDVGDAEHFGVIRGRLGYESVRQAAQSIRIVHDRLATNDPQFKQARDLISNASCVAFIGFGYNETNVDRLKVRECMSEEIKKTGRLFASRCGMGAAEVELATDALGIQAPKVQFAPSRWDALEFLREYAPLR